MAEESENFSFFDRKRKFVDSCKITKLLSQILDDYWVNILNNVLQILIW